MILLYIIVGLDFFDIAKRKDLNYMAGIIGFMGPLGTFSQEAVEAYSEGSTYELRDYFSIPEVLSALKNGDIEKAIVPIENSLEGAVNVTMDFLAKEDGLYIIGELIIPINLNLLTKTGTIAEDIDIILSHPQPLGQCRDYLNKYFPNAVQLEETSTSRAAQKVADSDGTYAAIASNICAKVYGLEIMASKIQDFENNSTRFVIISKTLQQRTGNDKTSIVFSTDNKPGSLYKILDIFSLWDINMTRIESRPAKNVLGQYVFFIDIDGHIEDQDVFDALTMIQRKTSFYRFIGSYPIFA